MEPDVSRSFPSSPPDSRTCARVSLLPSPNSSTGDSSQLAICNFVVNVTAMTQTICVSHAYNKLPPCGVTFAGGVG